MFKWTGAYAGFFQGDTLYDRFGRYLGWREAVTLAPLLVFVFWIGLAPEPFLRVMRPSLDHLLAQTGYHAQSALALAELVAR